MSPLLQAAKGSVPSPKTRQMSARRRHADAWPTLRVRRLGSAWHRAAAAWGRRGLGAVEFEFFTEISGGLGFVRSRLAVLALRVALDEVEEGLVGDVLLVLELGVTSVLDASSLLGQRLEQQPALLWFICADIS